MYVYMYTYICGAMHKSALKPRNHNRILLFSHTYMYVCTYVTYIYIYPYTYIPYMSISTRLHTNQNLRIAVASLWLLTRIFICNFGMNAKTKLKSPFILHEYGNYILSLISSTLRFLFNFSFICTFFFFAIQACAFSALTLGSFLPNGSVTIEFSRFIHFILSGNVVSARLSSE